MITPAEISQRVTQAPCPHIVTAQVTDALTDMRRHAEMVDQANRELISECDALRAEAMAIAEKLAGITCTHHNDQERNECPVCLVTQLRADNLAAHQMACAAALERDQLRAALGLPTDEPNANGSAHARIGWWKVRCGDLSEELAKERARLEWIINRLLRRHDGARP